MNELPFNSAPAYGVLSLARYLEARGRLPKEEGDYELSVKNDGAAVRSDGVFQRYRAGLSVEHFQPAH